MSEANISAAFETRLNLMAPALATAYENVPYTPVTGTPYQRVQLIPARPENPTIGDDYFREVGFFQITLFYPLNTGRGAAQARAAAIKSHFKRATRMTANGQTIRVPTTPTVAPALQENDRYIIPVTIEYYSEIFTA